MSAVERAAEVIRRRMDHGDDEFAIASALYEWGQLLSDADRAVLDAADKWLIAAEVGAPWQQSTAGLEVAVRARRETQP